MRGRLGIVFILGMAMMMTGCMRLGLEFDRSNNHYRFHHELNHSPERFYEGTREMAKTEILFSPLFLDIPCEILADTLFLPVDIWMYSRYLMHPPLATLVKKHKLDALAKRLAAGDPPDAEAVHQAIRLHDSKAFALLVEYGAVITDEAYYSPYSSVNLQNKEIIRIALKYDNRVSSKNAKSAILLRWMQFLEQPNMTMSPSEEADFLEVIEMLLHHGFVGINYYGVEYDLFRRTPLDIARRNTVLSETNRSHLVSILKSHGAMTYEELARKENLPHLRTENLDIHPMFKSVLELLATDKRSESIRLATYCQGIEAPVLVVDRPEEWRTIKIHRRKADGKWNQDTEDFAMSSGLRMIFTPPGVYAPSRIQADMPQFLLLERRVSFMDFELLLESPGMIARYLNWPEFRSLDSKLKNWESIYKEVMRLPRNPDGKFKEMKTVGKLFFGTQYGCLSTYLSLTECTPPLTKADEEWIEKANRLTAGAGLGGRWRGMQYENDPLSVFYVFSNYERSHENRLSDEIPAPYPDEIVCILSPKMFGQFSRLIGRDAETGTSYWNGGKILGTIILFGDEVTEEMLNLLESTISDIMKQ